jgi:hypothetical protein
MIIGLKCIVDFSSGRQFTKQDLPAFGYKLSVKNSFSGCSEIGNDRTNGRALTGVIHFLNETPVDWFSK